MKTLTVRVTDIINAMRFDSGFHLSEGTLYLKKLHEMPHEELQNLTSKIFTAGRSKRMYTDRKFGYPYLSNSDVVKQNPINGCKYNSRKYGFDELSFLKEGMIVTGRVGAIGQTAYITSEFEELDAMGSDNMIRIVPKDKNKSGYIYSFLVSKYGNTLLWKLAAGGVQPYITEEMIKDMPIPVFCDDVQHKIHNLIIEASALRTEANKLLRKADQLFISNLNINDELFDKITNSSESATSSSFIVKKSSITSLSIRSRTYSERLKLIKEVFQNGSHESLISLLQYAPVKGGRYKRVEVSEKSINAVELLNQGDLHNLKPKGKIISKKYIDNLDNQTAKKYMIIVPAVGTLGENEIFSRPLFVHGYLEGKVLSEHLLRIMPDRRKIDPGYLFIVLKSDLFFRIFRSIVYGTNLLYYILPLLEEMPIPRLSGSIEKEIGSLVKTAYEKLSLGNIKEFDAINIVENAIESWQN
jgi:type I restriction enzyme S subunit